MCKNLNKEQIEATFKKFDQTGNDKLSFREFRDMMGKRSESKGKTVKQQPGSEQASSNGKQTGVKEKQSGNKGKQTGNTGDQTSTDAKQTDGREKQSGNTGEQSGNKSGRQAASSEKSVSCQEAKTAKEGDQADP